MSQPGWAKLHVLPHRISHSVARWPGAGKGAPNESMKLFLHFWGRWLPFLFLLSSFWMGSFLPVAAQTPVGLGWAKNNVNGAIFRKNSVVSHGREQYTGLRGAG
jgi:hypothetical protein